MIDLPGIKTTQGEAFDGEFTLSGQDWTGFTGTGTIKRKRSDEEALLTFTPVGDANGRVTYQIANTADLPALPRSGTFATCWCQIRMTNGSDVVTFQFPVGVAGAL